MSHLKDNIPQEGRDAVPQSLPGILPGCPSDSGGGKNARASSKDEEDERSRSSIDDGIGGGEAGRRTPTQVDTREVEVVAFVSLPRVARTPETKVRSKTSLAGMQGEKPLPAEREGDGDHNVAGPEEGGFTRSRKTARTPPIKRGRVSSLPDRLGKRTETGSGGDKREAEGRSTKRRREDLELSPRSTQDEAAEGLTRTEETITRIIGGLNEEVKIVIEVAKERNTKREIKEAAGKMQALVGQLEEGVRAAIQQTARNEESAGMRVLKERIDELERSNNELKAQNRALRKDMEEIRAKEQAAGNPVQPINKMEEDMFPVDGNYEQFAKIERLEWPVNIFKAVEQAAGSPLVADRGTDLVMLREKWHQGNVWIEEEFLERYPDLREVEEKMAAISVTTKLLREENSDMHSERWIFSMVIENGDKDYFESLVKLREMLIRGGRTRVAMYPPGNDPVGTRTKKMLEWIFRDAGVVCQLHTKRKAKEPTRPTQPKDKEHTQPRQTAQAEKRRGDALIINQQGKGYAEALKKFKERVKPGSLLSKAIRTIRESKSGNMVVVLEKNSQQAAEELRKEIKKMDELKLVRDTGVEESTLFLYEVDAVTTKDEVRDALCQELGIDERAIRVGEPRKTSGSNQMMRIDILREKGEMLMNRGGIKIGLNWCPIKEKVDVKSCYRCWNYGHLARDCKAREDGSKLCRKCGEGAHIAKDCNGEKWCLTCKKEGHTAGSGVCPEFRKAVRRERLKNKQKRTL